MGNAEPQDDALESIGSDAKNEKANKGRFRKGTVFRDASGVPFRITALIGKFFASVVVVGGSIQEMRSISDLEQRIDPDLVIDPPPDVAEGQIRIDSNGREYKVLSIGHREAVCHQKAIGTVAVLLDVLQDYKVVHHESVTLADHETAKKENEFILDRWRRSDARRLKELDEHVFPNPVPEIIASNETEAENSVHQQVAGDSVPMPKTSGLTFSKAFEAMKQGKRVRRRGWNFNESMKPGTLHLNSEDAAADDWEIVLEPMTFEQAIVLLKQGKAISRRGRSQWTKTTWKMEGGFLGVLDRMELTGADILANDWHEVTT